MNDQKIVDSFLDAVDGYKPYANADFDPTYFEGPSIQLCLLLLPLMLMESALTLTLNLFRKMGRWLPK